MMMIYLEAEGLTVVVHIIETTSGKLLVSRLWQINFSTCFSVCTQIRIAQVFTVMQTTMISRRFTKHTTE
jgi:hypothetical protein